MGGGGGGRGEGNPSAQPPDPHQHHQPTLRTARQCSVFMLGPNLLSLISTKMTTRPPAHANKITTLDASPIDSARACQNTECVLDLGVWDSCTSCPSLCTSLAYMMVGITRTLGRRVGVCQATEFGKEVAAWK